MTISELVQRVSDHGIAQVVTVTKEMSVEQKIAQLRLHTESLRDISFECDDIISEYCFANRLTRNGETV